MAKRTATTKLPPREGLGGGYHSSKPVPTALREREADSLPYGGGNFSWNHSNVIVTAAKTSPGGSGKLLDRYHPKGVSEKPGGLGKLLDRYHPKGVIKNLRDFWSASSRSRGTCRPGFPWLPSGGLPGSWWGRHSRWRCRRGGGQRSDRGHSHGSLP